MQAEVDRENLVHLFGNLTLLTSSLNSSVSNKAWPEEKRKRAALENHDVLLINRGLRGRKSWDENVISERTGAAADALIRTWPVPECHDVVPVARTGKCNTQDIAFREIVAIGILPPGTELFGRGGNIEVDGRVLESPSGAAKVILGRSSNGWKYWRTVDGYPLNSYKPQFLQLQERRSAKQRLH